MKNRRDVCGLVDPIVINFYFFLSLLSNLNSEIDDNNLIFNKYLSNYTILPKTKKLLGCMILGTRVLRYLIQE